MKATKSLIRNADIVVTMNDDRQEIAGGDILIENGRIAAVGQNLPRGDVEVIEAGGCVVTPGLINTHHHLFQTLTRAVPAAQAAGYAVSNTLVGGEPLPESPDAPTGQ